MPPASLLVALQVRDKPVLIIGGGAVATSRVEHLLTADAQITLIAPEITTEKLPQLISEGKIKYYKRRFEPNDIFLEPPSAPSTDYDDIIRSELPRQYAAVFSAIDDPVESRKIGILCRYNRIPVNVADVPDLCDFYFGAVHRSGAVQVMVSTNGRGPRLAHRIRDDIAAFLDPSLGPAVENIALVRGEIRKKEKDVKTRMEWMKTMSDKLSYSEWARVNPGELAAIYPSTEYSVPGTEENVADTAELAEKLQETL